MKVEHHGDLVVKEAEDGTEGDRLAAEAAALRVLAHPGVVSLVRCEEGHGSGGVRRIVLRKVHGSTLEGTGPQCAEVVAGWTAALASVLADLHALGYSHGAVRADHVLIDEHGRPVLCGFGAARPVSAEEASRAFAADVGALACLGLDRLRGEEIALRRLLSRWAAGKVRHPGDARALARAVVERVPGAHIVGRVDPTGPGSQLSDRGGGGAPDPRTAECVGGAAPGHQTAEWVGDGASGHPTAEWVGDRSGPHIHERVGDGARSPRASLGTAFRGVALVGVGTAFGGVARTSAGTAFRRVALVGVGAVLGAFGAFLLAPVNRSSGPHGAARPMDPAPVQSQPLPGYVLQAEQDQQPLVVMGRWGCGPLRPAVLDERSGAVWVFPTWPTAGGHVVARYLGRVPTASGLGARSAAAGCDRLVVLESGAPDVTIPIPATP